MALQKHQMTRQRTYSYDPPLEFDATALPEVGSKTALRLKLPAPPNGDESDEAFFYRSAPGQVVGYFNRCSHVTVPMDLADGVFLDNDGFIMCRIHGARYDLQTGEPVLGPGRFPLARIRCEESSGVLRVLGWER